MLSDHRLIRSLLHQKVDRTPVWIMRQAGRYLPEYRALREKAGDFLKLCKNPEWACTISLQPLKRFPLDAAIIFSDILTIPDAMGLGLSFVEGEGPRFAKPIRSKEDIEQLPKVDVAKDLKYVTDAIKLLKQELGGKLPLIGFSGSPWTLAVYMVEGQASKEQIQIRRLLYQDPVLLQTLIQKITENVIEYLNAQIEAGAEVLMIFDTWGGLLSRQNYLLHSLEPIRKIAANLKKGKNNTKIPLILFTKNGGQHILDSVETGVDAIGLDWTANLRLAREQVGDKVALQGNLDPAVLYSSAEQIKNSVAEVLEQFGPGQGHIFNLGHGIPPDVDPDRVSVMIEAVQELSKTYHRT